MTSQFTSSDSRLRPRTDFTVTDAHPYEVDSYNFPALYAQFDEMRHKAGAPDYRLMLFEHDPNSGLAVYGPRYVKIGINDLNQHSYRQVVSMVSHELGHVWRAKHPNAPNVAIRLTPADLALLDGTQRQENEADLVGLCMNYDPAAMAQVDDTFRQDPEHPHPALRVEAMQQLKMSDCPHFDTHDNRAVLNMPKPQDRTAERNAK